jgi:SSS family solute:Na+ symporter
MIGLALFATNISCVHLVSLAQSGFDTGLLNGDLNGWPPLRSYYWLCFLRLSISNQEYLHLPDFLEKRYDRASRDWLAIISVVSAVIIHIAFSLLAGGIVLHTLFGVDMYTSVIVIAIITTIYTIVGGLTAVVVTESIQTIVLLGGRHYHEYCRVYQNGRLGTYG